MSIGSSIDLGDISLIEIQYTIGGVDYILKEASGDAACQYRNALFKDIQLGPEGKPSKIGNMADVEPLLVSLCLFNPEGRKIAVDSIRKWPNRIIKQLFEKVKEISDLNEESDERTQLEEAMDYPGSPCKFTDLQTYIASLKGENYSAIRNWMGKPVEEHAKNGQGGIEDGSS